MINAYWENLNFDIQEGKASDWLRVVDRSVPAHFDLFEIGKEQALNSLRYNVKGRSVVVLGRTT
jgi:isoamylase